VKVQCPSSAASPSNLTRHPARIRRSPGGNERPSWIDRSGTDTLVVLDEAGMAAAISYVTDRGGIGPADR
jgi:hypothetical protein